MGGEFRAIIFGLLLFSALAFGVSYYLNDLSSKTTNVQLKNFTSLSKQNELEGIGNDMNTQLKNANINSNPLIVGYIVLTSVYSLLKGMIGVVVDLVTQFFTAVAGFVPLPSWVFAFIGIAVAIMVSFALIEALLRYKP